LKEVLAANIRHGLFYTFQPQDEIISKRYLFHGQGEPFVPQAIKDTLPYLLGAVRDDHVAKRNSQRIVRDRLRDKERRLAEVEAIQGDGFGRATTLLAEAQDIGLFKSDVQPSTWDELIGSLRLIVSRPPAAEPDHDDTGNRLSAPLSEKDELYREFRKVKEQIAAVNSLLAAEVKFAHESKEQIARLKSVELYRPPNASEPATCPVCRSLLTDQVPAVSAIQRGMEQLSRQLGSLSEEAPLLGSVITKLKDQAADFKRKMSRNKELLDALGDSDERVGALLDDTSKRSLVIGRISLYLESVPVASTLMSLKREVEELRRQDEALKAELSSQSVKIK
jgi:hypothetical protein